MFATTDPKTLKTWLIIAGVVYFLFPFDLLPDFLGIPGRIDDGLIIAWLAWFYRGHLRRFIAKEFGTANGPQSESFGKSRAAGTAGRSGSATGGGFSSSGPKGLSPFQILGIDRSASGDEIKQAYRARMREYHPDKVAHLGEDLRTLAHEKSQEIQRAYREVKG